MLGKIKKLISRPEWKRQYKNQISLRKKIRKKEGSYRFNMSYIRVSDIAAQFYDEKKLENEFLQGEIETEELKIGKKGHEKLIEQKKKITIKEGWQKIYTSRRLLLSEFPFSAQYKGIPIIGKPDLVAFVDGQPILLFEFKFSKYQRSFMSHHVQLRVEGLILKELGFDTSSLMYVIIIAPFEMKDQAKELNAIPKIIAEKYLDNRKELLYQGV